MAIIRDMDRVIADTAPFHFVAWQQTARDIGMEDTAAGVGAAKNAGMRRIAVTNIHTADGLAGADVLADSVEEVTAGTLESMLGLLSSSLE